jgi:hypothetical protein
MRHPIAQIQSRYRETYSIGSINMTVASVDSGLDSIVDFFGLGLPSSQTDGRDSGASVAVDGCQIKHNERGYYGTETYSLKTLLRDIMGFTSDENFKNLRP